MQPANWVVAGLLGLAGCQSNTTTKAETKVAEKPVAAVPATSAVTVWVGPPFVGYHRYRGTVGGQPVTVELTMSQPPLTRDQAAHAQDFVTCKGTYHYDHHPTGLLLLRDPRPWQPGQPLLLKEASSARPRQPTGYWQAGQPAGPVLTGTWRSPAGQQLPFRLHEDYTDGQGHVVEVQYEMLQEDEEAPCQPARKEGESKAAYRARTQDLTSTYHQDFLHLLGPDTLRPALRRLQCPVPAKRRQQTREQAGGCNQVEHQLQVVYNDHGLLSLERAIEDFYEGADHPSHEWNTTTYDLRTGQPLAITALIRPGTDSILGRLIAQHLEKDEFNTLEDLLNSPAADSASAPLLQLGLGIGDEGLEFTYSNTYDSLTPPVTVKVSYAELLPLLRPDSPVARMLRERGLWRAGKKQ